MATQFVPAKGSKHVCNYVCQQKREERDFLIDFLASYVTRFGKLTVFMLLARLHVIHEKKSVHSKVLA